MALFSSASLLLKRLPSSAMSALVLLVGCSDGGKSNFPGIITVPETRPIANDTILNVKCTGNAAVFPSTSSGDPLYAYQWYLKNIGQRVLADTLPCTGVDLNIGTLHDRGIRGKGITVAVIDSGLDIHHEDLMANVVPGGSKNFDNGSNDPIDIGGHGTAVAGVIAAAGWNGIGGRGVAPDASLKGFNAGEMIYSGSFSDQQAAFKKYFGYSWGEGTEAKDVDVFNNSLGLAPTGLYPDISQKELSEWENLMSTSRGGRGGIYIWAGGNGFLQPKDVLNNNDQNAGCDANKIGLSCTLTNLDTPTNFIHMITVASVNARGVRSYFSSAGSSLWVSAPGGEDGLQQAFSGPNKHSYGPGILTTDVSGCAEGFNTSTLRNNALDGGTPLDPNCNYTASFSGTSSAAPMVSGIAALMLGVNPTLTQRDVKYILASTARPLDLAQPSVIYAGSIAEPGWIKNTAGYRFSNWYGFGLVDASAAVAMATGFKSLPPLIDSGWLASSGSPVNIGSVGSSAAMKVRVDQDMVIEAVQFNLGTNHGEPSNLLATLASPSGTKSYVLTPFSTLKDSENFTIPLSSSNAFFGEKSRGDWVLRITDVSGKPVNAQLQSLQLRVVGHSKPEKTLKLYGP